MALLVREAAAAPTGLVLGLPAEPVFLVIGAATHAPAIREALSGVGPSVWLDAADSREALVRLSERTPDVVFIDGRDPRALELCRVVKAQPMSATIAVIAIGGGTAGREDAVDAGCDHWLPAPFSASELYSRSLHLLRTRALFRALVDAHDEQRRRRDWVRYLVHDLRNGLSSILSNFEYVGESLRGDTESQTAMREASFAARRMAALLQDMLDVDRIRRNELRPRPSRFDLAQLLNQTATDVRMVARARGSVIQLSVTPVEVEADRTLIERVMANLFGNSVRYARSFIRVRAVAGDEAVRIVVANDGPPIPADARERIFVPFMQLDGERAGGAGLGLPFCRLVLEAHGGSIALAESSDDDTVQFVVTLPRRTPAR